MILLFLVSGLHADMTRTLREAFDAALERSAAVQTENILVQKELLEQANEAERQSVAALLPSITASGVFLTQPAPSSTLGSSVYPRNQNTIKITGSQPLFRGLREFAALRQKKLMTDVQKQTFVTAARQLYYDVATAFYNVLGNQSDVMNYRLEIQESKERLKELERFFAIGRAQETDVLTYESTIASTEVLLAASEAQLEVAREVLYAFTGWAVQTIHEPEFELRLKERAYYLGRVNDRDDVQVATSNYKSNLENRPIAWGQHLPSVDLVGNFYALRPGTLHDVHWDASVQVTMPLYQGGSIDSQVRQAESQGRVYSLLLNQARTTAEQEIATFFDIATGDMNQLTKLAGLTIIARKNYDTEARYFRHGLVTNLDVLQARTTFTDARRQWDRMKTTAFLDHAKLEAAVGDRPELLAIMQKFGDL